MSAPLAYTVHPGGRVPDGTTQQVLADWMPANGINPTLVSADDPITVLPVPYGTGEDGGPWMIQVIVFSQFHVDHTGAKEQNLITRQPVTFQRTVPLRVPFPTSPTTDGEDHGQADGQAAQETPEEFVRPAGEAQVPPGYEGEGPQRPLEGSAKRVEGNPEEDPGQGHQAVSEPEEDQQEEVGAR